MTKAECEYSQSSWSALRQPHNGISFPEVVYSILNVLPLYSNIDTPGLLNSTLYDVIPLMTGASGNVTVNATMFQASCEMVRNATLSDFEGSAGTFDLTITSDFTQNVAIGVSPPSSSEYPLI